MCCLLKFVTRTVSLMIPLGLFLVLHFVLNYVFWDTLSDFVIYNHEAYFIFTNILQHIMIDAYYHLIYQETYLCGYIVTFFFF